MACQCLEWRTYCAAQWSGSSGSRPMSDGRRQGPGGWNRIVLTVNDLTSLVATMKRAGLHFRNEIETGPGGKQMQVEHPDGNDIERSRNERSRFIHLWKPVRDRWRNDSDCVELWSVQRSVNTRIRNTPAQLGEAWPMERTTILNYSVDCVPSTLVGPTCVTGSSHWRKLERHPYDTNFTALRRRTP